MPKAPEPKWCCECQWWNFSYQDGVKKFGKCNNPDVEDDVRVTEAATYEDEAVFTYEHFGCVWFEKEDKVVAEIPKPKQ